MPGLQAAALRDMPSAGDPKQMRAPPRHASEAHLPAARQKSVQYASGAKRLNQSVKRGDALSRHVGVQELRRDGQDPTCHVPGGALQAAQMRVFMLMHTRAHEHGTRWMPASACQLHVLCRSQPAMHFMAC